MHLGRSYPWHPVYWATEACFWPGFVGWKMRTYIDAQSAYPWSILQTPFNEASDAGTVSSDAKTIYYHWSLSASAPATDLELSLNLAEYLGTKYTRYQWRLYNSLIVIAYAFKWNPFPTTSWGFSGLPPQDQDHPGPGTQGYNMQALPATYAEGGSPFPND